MDIKILGSGCDRCDALYANTCEALKNLGVEADVEKVEDLLEIVLFGVMSVPALMVNGKILLSGRTADTKEITKLLKKYM
jgi:small redox-active disulfide protein 2